MSVQSELSRLSGNVQNTLDVISSTGIAVEEGANSNNLPALVLELANTKQDALTFDDVPTAGSTNPVTSGGVKTALDEIAGTLAPPVAITDAQIRAICT